MGKFREYEVKVKINDVKKTSKKLERIADRVKRVRQIDEYFDFLPLRLTKKDELLRIRSEYEQASEKFISGEFSWKSGRKGIKKDYEVREDISREISNIEDIDSLRQILEKLGIIMLAKLEKIRDRWVLNNSENNIEFEFDKEIHVSGLNIPHINIGGYLQATIETDKDNISRSEVKEILWNVLRSSLGFSKRDFEPRSYIEISIGIKNPRNLSTNNQ
ncbi:MAG: CYTH domain-containing protein [Candidatus Lokiarchaeota archaeon]|nr:CYTH domain-containing protein [Candidatus Lokiarchaeota archaeon]